MDQSPPRTGLEATWALVPLRGLEDAKTRLGSELDPEERLELVAAMATRTLEATRDAPGISGTVLVTADPAAARLAAGFGARTIVQRLPGLNAALREARTMAVELGATATLVLPIDLPGISVAAIERLVGEAGAAASEEPGRPIVLAVPDRHGAGTNALLVAPPGVIEPAFGEGSLAAHGRAAAAAGATFILVGGPLAFDVDTGADLLAAEATATRWTPDIGRTAGGRDAA
jgi:2-phospho-L-lactate guanylyltransferase